MTRILSPEVGAPPPATGVLPVAPMTRTLALSTLVAVLTYAGLANAWLGDDSFITFRVIDNFLNGYGLTFNPPERVQVYTHPLWMGVMTVAHAITREFLFTTSAVSLTLNALTLLVFYRFSGRQLMPTALFVGWVVSSKAFGDYLNSGLENPLSFLLLALFFARALPVARARNVTPSELRTLVLIAALGFVNRADAILLYAPMLIWMSWSGVRRETASTLKAVAIGAAPAWLWLVFATVYYGFPLPNTYYAKVATGIPASLLYQQGIAYVLNSLARDPITLTTIALAGSVAVSQRRAAAVLAVTGSVLYVFYTISVGGDFMSGRFFSMPFLVAVMVLVNALGTDLRSAALTGAVLVAYNLVMPLVPLKTTADYDGAWPWRQQNGLKDERGHYHRATNILFFDPFRTLPDQVWYKQGLSFRNSPEPVRVEGSIGYIGYMAGPQKYVLDRNALSDPLLARLPVSDRLYFEFFVGHYFRDIPDGYLESIAAGNNQLGDPLLRDYYDRLRRVTRGPLFGADRLADIWRLNVGPARNLHEKVNARRRVALSIRAANERFLTDVGERDSVNGVLRSTGRAGYLQFGPRTPLRPGRYRVRWIGAIDSVPAEEIGFVEALADGEPLAKRPVAAQEYTPERKQLADLEFVLPRATSGIEYRLFVGADVRVTLERVEISGGPLPAPGR
jgi:arabinofuranosyltransferase